MKDRPTYSAEEVITLLNQIKTNQGIQVLYDLFHSEVRHYSEDEYLMLRKAISDRRNYLWKTT